jgi:hypothetical protein
MFSTNPVLSTLLALGLTLALIWLAARLLMIFSPILLRPGAPRTSTGSAILTLESVTPIAPRRRVIVLRYGEQRLAVLTGGPQDVSLGWLPPPSSPSP